MYLLQKNKWEKLASDLAEAGNWEHIDQIQINMVMNTADEATRLDPDK